MGLFNFGKKKKEEEGCCCSAAAEKTIEKNMETERSKYIVLGACCKKSEETFENTKTALREMGISDEVRNIGDAVEIARYGVMQTPALVIAGKVVSTGKLLKVEEVKKLVEKQQK